MSTKKTKKPAKQSQKKSSKKTQKPAAKKAAKVQYITACDLASEMGLSTRDHNPTDGSPRNPLLMMVRAPNHNEGKLALMTFIKRTGLQIVRKGKESIRYIRGAHYWLVQVKKAEFQKAKAVLIPPPTPKANEGADEEYGNEDGPDDQDCEACGDECAPRDYSKPPKAYPEHATPSGSYNDGVEACARFFESERNQGLADALRRNCKQ